MLKNKKGIALNQAFGAVLTLVLVAVLVIIGIVIFVSIGATFVDLATTSVINETVDMSLGGPQTVNNATTLCNFEDFTVTEVSNESSGQIIDSGNYTITSDGTITNTTSFFSNDWLVSYGGNWGGSSCIASKAMVTQFATYPILVGLVGTIIFLGLVIGVLVASFVFGRKEGV